MSMEYTGIGKEAALSKIADFFESQPDDAIFKLVINSKRGNIRLKIKKKSRVRKLLGRFKR